MSSLATVVYTPKSFIPHAVSLRQAFAHCAIFPVAATRRCRFRVSVTLWPVVLSHRLAVVALVGHYPTNKLIARELLLKRPDLRRDFALKQVQGTCGITPPFDGLFPTLG